MPTAMSVRLRFTAGTLEIHGPDEALAHVRQKTWDARVGAYRARAIDYRGVVTDLKKAEVAFDDEARTYETIDATFREKWEAFPHQREAIAAWERAGGRGLVVLPTGSGKTLVAAMAIASRKRSTLVVVPTIDLLTQWYDGLRAFFGEPIGMIGGGTYDVQPITVSTYDSAHIHMEHLGHRFGLVIFDEAHHLPSPAYSVAAQMCLAPYRMGLTATPERADGGEAAYEDLVGPTVYRKSISELAGTYLAPYRTVRLEVSFSDEERASYAELRERYLGFVRRMGISLGEPQGFSTFLQRASRTDEGRRALDAFREQRRLAFRAPAKIRKVGELIGRHKNDRILLFTDDNATVYHLSETFLVPALTHRTPPKERSEILQKFNDGRYFAVATSRVLNEGVNVPAANVAVVLSGTSSVREHVQRLGRILRRQGDKEAILYEIVTRGTSEESTSTRRRDHVAYR